MTFNKEILFKATSDLTFMVIALPVACISLILVWVMK